MFAAGFNCTKVVAEMPAKKNFGDLLEVSLLGFGFEGRSHDCPNRLDDSSSPGFPNFPSILRDRNQPS